MVLLKSCALYLAVSHVLVYISYVASQEMTDEEKAYLLSETKCQQLNNPFVAAPILLTAAQLVFLAKTVEIVNPMQGRYSMKVTPQCIMKGVTNEKEILIQNLGKTKCGASNVEVGFNYLFFLRNTSDPKVFHALNSGAKVVRSTILWTDVFPMLCGIKRRVVCTTGNCPGACSYEPPKPSACIPGHMTVADTFRNAFPHGPPTSTHKPSTAEMVKTNAPQGADKVTSTFKTNAPQGADKVTSTFKPSTQKVAIDSKPATPKPTAISKATPKTTAISKATPKTTADEKATKVKQMDNISKPPVNTTLTTTAPSTKQPMTANTTDTEMTEKMRSDNKTEAKDDSKKKSKAAPYTPMVNGTVAVQQSKSNPNGQGSIHSNEPLVIVTFFVLHLLRS